MEKLKNFVRQHPWISLFAVLALLGAIIGDGRGPSSAGEVVQEASLPRDVREMLVNRARAQQNCISTKEYTWCGAVSDWDRELRRRGYCAYSSEIKKC